MGLLWVNLLNPLGQDHWCQSQTRPAACHDIQTNDNIFTPSPPDLKFAPSTISFGASSSLRTSGVLNGKLVTFKKESNLNQLPGENDDLRHWTDSKQNERVTCSAVLVFTDLTAAAWCRQLTCGHRVDPELGKLLLLGHMRGQKPWYSAEFPVQPADLSGLHVAAAPTGQARVQPGAPPQTQSSRSARFRLTGCWPWRHRGPYGSSVGSSIQVGLSIILIEFSGCAYVVQPPRTQAGATLSASVFHQATPPGSIPFQNKSSTSFDVSFRCGNDISLLNIF